MFLDLGHLLVIRAWTFVIFRVIFLAKNRLTFASASSMLASMLIETLQVLVVNGVVVVGGRAVGSCRV
jgi:uncharacterized protein YhhL (DUF1145 family)